MSNNKPKPFSFDNSVLSQQRLNEDQIQALIAEICQAYKPSFNLTSLEPLRQGSNLVLVDRVAKVVIRVHLKPNLYNEVADQNQRISKLRQQGLPFLKPLADQPIHISDQRCATIWPLGKVANPDDMTELANMVSQIQEQAETEGFPFWLTYQTEDINNLLAMAKQAQAPLDLLSHALDWANKAHQAITTLWKDKTKDVLIFGDPSYNNTVIYKGQRLFIDFDEIGRGPYEIDLAIIKASDRRGGSNHYPTFASILGGIPDAELIDQLVKLREAAMAIWTATYWSIYPDARPSIIERLTTLDRLTKWAIWPEAHH